LQALQRPVWTLWISVYRKGFGVAFFIWVFIGVLDFDVWGVWFGIATAVASGWLVALVVVRNVAKTSIGGLLRADA
jgi:Na+-driven multidrug efflux pump